MSDQVLVSCGSSARRYYSGDGASLFDPYFVSYLHLVHLAGGRPVVIDTYPDFRLNVDKVRAALTPWTKVIIVNSPGNPTGALYSREELRDLALLAKEHGILLGGTPASSSWRTRKAGRG